MLHAAAQPKRYGYYSINTVIEVSYTANPCDSRAQVEDGLSRGDFTVKYLAHAAGLKEWLPLGEVLDYVERNEGSRTTFLPPVPAPRDLPPVPEPAGISANPVPSIPAPAPSAARPPVLPAPSSRAPAPPPPIQMPVSPVPEKKEIPLAPKPEVLLTPAPFLPRAIAFLIDGAILFVPIGILYLIGALSIEIPAAWHHIPHQARMDEWDHLKLNMARLFWQVLIGFGWFYGAGLECSPSQATVGKRFMGLKVTDLHGERIGFLRASARYAAKYLSALPCFLGFIMALFSSRGLALHDRLADTRVVRN